MQKRILMMLGMLLVAMLGIMPIIGQEETEVAPITEITWTCPEGYEGQTLVLFNWLYYISDVAIKEFETRCGVTIRLETYGSNEELVGAMRQGNAGYDVAFPNDYAISVMIREGLIVPLDYSKIPNYANIDDRYKGLSFDPTNEYTVPYLWGTFGALYNTDVYGEEITTWEQIWNFPGRIGWTDDQRSLLGLVLRELGYNPNSTDEGQIYEALDVLIGYAQNSDLVHISDDASPVFVRGDLDLVLTYSGDAYQRIVDCDCDNFKYAVPTTGTVADITAMVILKDAPNPELSYLFIDFMQDPFVAALNSNDTAYATTNSIALESGLINPDFLTNEAIMPNPDALDNLWFIEDIADAEFIYADVWDEFLIAISQ